MNPRQHAYYKLTPEEERAQKKRNIALAAILFGFISFTGVLFFFKMTDTKDKAPEQTRPAASSTQSEMPDE